MRARAYEFQSNILLLSNSSVPGSLVIRTHGSFLVFFSSAMFLLCLRLGTSGLILELACQCPQNSLVLGLYLIASQGQREQV